eukprot:6545482-Pyramimonas_sp.AAC.2
MVNSTLSVSSPSKFTPCSTAFSAVGMRGSLRKSARGAHRSAVEMSTPENSGRGCRPCVRGRRKEA